MEGLVIRVGRRHRCDQIMFLYVICTLMYKIHYIQNENNIYLVPSPHRIVFYPSKHFIKHLLSTYHEPGPV